MSDDTTHPATGLQPKLPMSRQMALALATVAVMTAFIAALSFILSFDALRALAIEVGVQPRRAWMAPVAIDVAQAAATAGYVIFRITGRGRYSLVYCASLAVVTVLLSVVGNAFHAWQTAERNIARVAAGEDLGFVPQAPWIGALFAAIFPLLWLALFHLFVMMVHRNQPSQVAPQPASAAAVALAGTNTAPQVASRWEHFDSGVGAAERPAPAPNGNDDRASAQLPWEIERVGATAPSAIPTPRNPIAAPATVDQPGPAATRNGYSQTQDGLLRFLEDSDFHETVKVVASMMVTAPQLRQIDVAHRLQIDKSTVSRRWRQFRESAETEGFSVPPLPVFEVGDQAKEAAFS